MWSQLAQLRWRDLKTLLIGHTEETSSTAVCHSQVTLSKSKGFRFALHRKDGGKPPHQQTNWTQEASVVPYILLLTSWLFRSFSLLHPWDSPEQGYGATIALNMQLLYEKKFIKKISRWFFMVKIKHKRRNRNLQNHGQFRRNNLEKQHPERKTVLLN